GQTPTYQGNVVRPDASWAIASVGDFNGDGIADILWRQTGAGLLANWTMNGSQIQSSQLLTSQGNVVAPDSSWTIAATGDFNRDGMADIIWRQSTTGAVVDWTMNGSQITASQNLTWGGIALTPDASWTMAGVGSFDGVHTALVWRQSGTGLLSEWGMTG